MSSRFLRWALNAIAIVSAALLLAIALIWLYCTERPVAPLEFSRVGSTVKVFSSSTGIEFTRSNQADSATLAFIEKTLGPLSVDVRDDISVISLPKQVWCGIAFQRGYELTQLSSGQSALSSATTWSALHIPYGWMLLATAMPVAIRLLLYRRRPLPGACPTCGYDLRATPTRCPECGRAPTEISARTGRSPQ